MSSEREDLKQKILSLTEEYANKYHSTNAVYKEGERISYAGRVFDSAEVVNLVDSALEFWLTSGRYSQLLEEKLRSFLGTKYCTLVNSGSSANLLAFMALTSPLLGERAIKRGDEVITVAAAFPTTVSPIVQFGAVPVFVDVTIPQYNVNPAMLEQAYSEKTKAVFLAHTLGNPFDIKAIKMFCEKYHLWLIEDNCDALGSEYELNGVIGKTGTFGEISTLSCYPPHHITMGEGGAVFTNDDLLHKIILSLRDWGRDCCCPSGVDNLCGHRFDKQYGELPLGYDHKYVYSHFGYNLKPTDMQAAVGAAQMDKLLQFIEARKRNFSLLQEGLRDLKDSLIFPEAEPNAFPSWFGFLMTCKEGINRNSVVEYLESHGIQTRMLFSGNLIKHPCFDQMKKSGTGYRVVGSLENTDRIMNDSFWVGVYPGLTDEKIAYIVDRLYEAIHG